jgi:Protein of unknown function (DUF3667)
MSPLPDDPGFAAHPAWVCPSCGSSSTGAYCARCGERYIAGSAGPPARGAAHEAGRSFFARLFASLRALASPPGRLTADWIGGRRVGYLAPLSLFLWVNVAFFLVQSASGLGVLTWPLQTHLSDESIAWLTTRLLALRRPDMAAPHDVTEVYTSIFNALESVHAKSLVIVMAPAFAAALAVLVLDRRHAFRDSLTFALHFFAFSLIWLSALFPMAAIVLGVLAIAGAPLPSHHGLDLAITALEAGMLAWYLYVALDTVFGLSVLRRFLTVPVLVFALLVILKAYHVVVFATTLYSI